jgi:hypothetical protein
LADSPNGGTVTVLGVHQLAAGDIVSLQFTGDQDGYARYRKNVTVASVDGETVVLQGGAGDPLSGQFFDTGTMTARASDADGRFLLGGNTTMRYFLGQAGRRVMLQWSGGSRQQMRLGVRRSQISSELYYGHALRIVGGEGDPLPDVDDDVTATILPMPSISVYPNEADPGEPWLLTSGDWQIRRDENSAAPAFWLWGSGDDPKITLGPTLLPPSQQILISVRPLHGQTYRIHFSKDYAVEFVFGTVNEEELGRVRFTGPDGTIAEDIAWSLNFDFSSGRPSVSLNVSVWYETDGDPINVTVGYPSHVSTIAVAKRLAVLDANDLVEGEIALSGDCAGEDLCFGAFSVTRIEQDDCTAATRLYSSVLRDDMPRYLRLTLGGYSGSAELQQLINREHLLLHDSGCSWGLQESGPANATGVDAPAFVSAQYGVWLNYTSSRCQLLLELYTSAAAGINGRWVTDLGLDKADLRDLTDLTLTPDPQFGSHTHEMTAAVSAEFDDAKPPPIDQFCGALTFEDAEPEEYLVSVRGFTADTNLNGDFIVRRLQRLSAAGSLWSYSEDLGGGTSLTVWMYLFNWQATVYLWKQSPGGTMSGTYDPYTLIFYKGYDGPFPPPDDDIPYCFSAQTIPPFYNSYPMDPDQSGSTCHISLVEDD